MEKEGVVRKAVVLYGGDGAGGGMSKKEDQLL